jgi:hypothetical protein
MRPILAVALAAFFFVAPARAENYQWTALETIESGGRCGVSGTRFNFAIKDNVLYARSTGRENWYMGLKPLKPDGSGRLVFKDDLGRENIFEFEAGTGPRKIRHIFNNCVYLWAP